MCGIQISNPNPQRLKEFGLRGGGMLSGVGSGLGYGCLGGWKGMPRGWVRYALGMG